MSPFHFCLSAARNLSSFHLLPASLITELLQLFFGLPLFLFPWGYQSRAVFVTSPSSFLNVWPIHPNLIMSICYIIKALLRKRQQKKIVRAKREEITDGWTNCKKRYTVICTRYQALLGDHIEDGEINNNCGSTGKKNNAFRI